MATSKTIKVTNLTRGSVLVSGGSVADTYWTSLRGLIGRRPLEVGEGLLIVPCKSVHTHFMSFVIDVLYLAHDLEVVGLDQGMKPWRFGRYYRTAHCVLELPAGTIEATDSEMGDYLAIEG